MCVWQMKFCKAPPEGYPSVQSVCSGLAQLMVNGIPGCEKLSKCNVRVQSLRRPTKYSVGRVLFVAFNNAPCCWPRCWVRGSRGVAFWSGVS